MWGEGEGGRGKGANETEGNKAIFSNLVITFAWEVSNLFVIYLDELSIYK